MEDLTSYHIYRNNIKLQTFSSGYIRVYIRVQYPASHIVNLCGTGMRMEVYLMESFVPDRSSYVCIFFIMWFICGFCFVHHDICTYYVDLYVAYSCIYIVITLPNICIYIRHLCIPNIMEIVNVLFKNQVHYIIFSYCSPLPIIYSHVDDYVTR